MEEDFNLRLSRITTIWSQVRDAHGADASNAGFQELFERYRGAVYQYLLGATRNPDVADDLFQEFATRLCSGKFATANPERGKFRNFLRTALINLINDYRRQNARTGGFTNDEEPPAETTETKDLDRLYVDALRDDLLNVTWNLVRCFEQELGQPYYTVLRSRISQPEMNSEALAAWLNEQSGGQSQYTAASIRKTLQRARSYFADVLIEEVAQRLGTHQLDEIERELIDLGLFAYCKEDFDRRRSKS
jgi:RNA polymerase sigma factor (sigma-70 family)